MYHIFFKGLLQFKTKELFSSMSLNDIIDKANSLRIENTFSEPALDYLNVLR